MDTAESLPIGDAVSSQLAGAAARFLAVTPAKAGEPATLASRLVGMIHLRLCGRPDATPMPDAAADALSAVAAACSTPCGLSRFSSATAAGAPPPAAAREVLLAVPRHIRATRADPRLAALAAAASAAESAADVGSAAVAAMVEEALQPVASFVAGLARSPHRPDPPPRARRIGPRDNSVSSRRTRFPPRAPGVPRRAQGRCPSAHRPACSAEVCGASGRRLSAAGSRAPRRDAIRTLP